MTAKQIFTFTTIQAPIQDFIIEDLASYIASRLGIPSQFIIDVSWQEREHRIDSGDIDVAWICGLPYVVKADRGELELELLAAPVMAGERYQDQAIYFSDVIVRSESQYHSFADLRGTTWTYNEPGSQSGYNITRYHLAKIDAPNPFFGRVSEGGSHDNCIQLVLNGDADAAAIDSTVLDLTFERDSHLNDQLRIVATLGPSPIPPLVISRCLDPEIREGIRALILEMHEDPDGCLILERGKIRRFQRVRDSDYDPIRIMAQAARDIQL
jgi:phosphonate transport system substrate-binding protein